MPSTQHAGFVRTASAMRAAEAEAPGVARDGGQGSGKGGNRLYALFVNMVGRSLLCSHRLRSREGGWMSQGLALTRWATLNVRSVSP